MSISDVQSLYLKGDVEGAYGAMLPIYADDHGEYASRMMFKVALAVLEKRLENNDLSELSKIYRALLRLVLRYGNEMYAERQALLKTAFQLSALGIDIDPKNSGLLLDGIISIPDVALPLHLQMGQWGETVAALYLQYQGCRLIEHDWKSSHRDIDLIVMDGQTIVFVEVKTRNTHSLQSPEQAVNYTKICRLRKSIHHYVKQHRVCSNIRFDIISVIGELGLFPLVRHLKDVPIMIR